MEQPNEQKDKTSVSRRDVIKAAGVMSLGLLYTKPFVEKIHAQGALVDSATGGGGGGGGGTNECPPGQEWNEEAGECQDAGGP